MKNEDAREMRARWRYSILGPLLLDPPAPGELAARLRELAESSYRDPITHESRAFSWRTLEAWYIRIRAKPNDPVTALRQRRRQGRGVSVVITDLHEEILRTLRREYPDWTTMLIHSEFSQRLKLCDTEGVPAAIPSYSTVLRWLKQNGLGRRRPSRSVACSTASETRRFEVERVGALWHLDFHQGSRKVLGPDGAWHKAILLCIIDDRSRYVCHAQWFRHEDTQALVHGFKQALLKAQVPRALMTDNGSAMTSSEFTEGLSTLGIIHNTTLPYSPNMNGKQERFFGTIEGQFLPLLVAEENLSLAHLNKLTAAWLEQKYQQTPQVELGVSPRARFLHDKSALRPPPDLKAIERAFSQRITRKPHRNTATVTVTGVRFELPAAHRHHRELRLRYRRWDLSEIWMVNPQDEDSVIALYPEDPIANADGRRAALTEAVDMPDAPVARPALLTKMIDDQNASGLPSAYIPDPRDAP